MCRINFFFIILFTCAVMVIYRVMTNNFEFMKIIVSLAVTVIPEGLELIVKINLSVIIFELKKKMIFVKNLISLEILGKINMVIFDKTGTITTGKQVVNKFLVIDLNYINDRGELEKIKFVEMENNENIFFL